MDRERGGLCKTQLNYDPDEEDDQHVGGDKNQEILGQIMTDYD